MHTIEQLRELVEEKLSTLESGSSPEQLYTPITYMLKLPAKRLRPALVLMGCELFGGEINAALDPAAGIEVFHNFTLMHDDIMDNAPKRRSHDTVHTRWGHNTAILSGDAMFVRSCQLMLKAPEYCRTSVMNSFLETAIMVCEGQQLDMDFERMQGISIEDYVDMITKKTAVLLAASLRIGAVIAGAGERDSEHLYEFGKNIGLAFQLKDDLLDVFGDQSLFGKQQGGDIISNKKTFLLLKSFELADNKIRNELNDFFSEKEVDPEEKVQRVSEIMAETGARDATEEQMTKYYNISMGQLSEIGVHDDRKEQLQRFAEMLMIRQS